MANATWRLLARWPALFPLAALVVLVLGWGRELPGTGLAVVGLCLAGAVLAAVHHAEVIAHRVGEPFGTLVLAVSVTLIEVGLILTLMASSDGSEADSLARGTGAVPAATAPRPRRWPPPARRLRPRLPRPAPQ